MKQKKGKMIRMVKETINKLKCESLKDSWFMKIFFFSYRNWKTLAKSV